MSKQEISIRVFGFILGFGIGIYALSAWSPVFGDSMLDALRVIFLIGP